MKLSFGRRSSSCCTAITFLSRSTIVAGTNLCVQLPDFLSRDSPFSFTPPQLVHLTTLNLFIAVPQGQALFQDFILTGRGKRGIKVSRLPKRIPSLDSMTPCSKVQIDLQGTMPAAWGLVPQKLSSHLGSPPTDLQHC